MCQVADQYTRYTEAVRLQPIFENDGILLFGPAQRSFQPSLGHVAVIGERVVCGQVFCGTTETALLLARKCVLTILALALVFLLRVKSYGHSEQRLLKEREIRG